MAAKTPIDKLGKEIGDILEEYHVDVQKNLNIITKKMGQKGAKALRNESRRVLNVHSGAYAKGWTYAFRKTRLYAKTTIYNEDYRRPHLLENAHDIKNRKDGPVYGRTKPHPHIAPIAEELEEAYVKEVMAKL